MKEYDVAMFVDRYQMAKQEPAASGAGGLSVQAEAHSLRRMANVFGKQAHLVVIVDGEDRQAIQAYAGEGFSLYTLNGNRPYALPHILADEAIYLRQKGVRRLVVVGSDPVFAALCSQVREAQADVTIWLPEAAQPAGLADFDCRPLDELIEPAAAHEDAAVLIDIENLVKGLLALGLKPTTQQILRAITAGCAGLGPVRSLDAFGDWGVIGADLGFNLQRELELQGVKTHYQVCQRGKNSADGSLASQGQRLVDEGRDLGLLVIVSGDRDFAPLVEYAHRRGVRVALLSLEDTLSRWLAGQVDEVRLLDGYFPAALRSPAGCDPQTKQLRKAALALSRLLHQAQEGYIPEGRLRQELPGDDIDAMREAGLLVFRQSLDGWLVGLDESQPLARAARFFGPWIEGRLRYIFSQGRLAYVDSAYLAFGMQHNQQCQEHALGQSRSDANAWLEAAAWAGWLARRTQRHPKDETKLIDTWWLVEQTLGQKQNRSD